MLLSTTYAFELIWTNQPIAFINKSDSKESSYIENKIKKDFNDEGCL